MPYRQQILDQPPSANTMDEWERDGWSDIQIIGPVLAKVGGDPDAKPTPVYVVYLYRSVIIGGTQALQREGLNAADVLSGGNGGRHPANRRERRRGK